MHDLDRIQMESFEFQGEDEGVFNENEVNELASELMEVSSEAEMEQFLGDFIKKAGRSIGSFIKSDAGRALGGILKAAAKQALPIAGSALGGLVGGPVGAMLGGKLAGFAGDKLGLEAEAEAEEREFETAKSFVRLAADAAKAVAAAPPGSNPRSVASAAVAAAAKAHMPSLLSGGAGASSASGRNQGKWVRRGSRIVLLGV